MNKNYKLVGRALISVLFAFVSAPGGAGELKRSASLTEWHGLPQETTTGLDNKDIPQSCPSIFIRERKRVSPGDEALKAGDAGQKKRKLSLSAVFVKACKSAGIGLQHAVSSDDVNGRSVNTAQEVLEPEETSLVDHHLPINTEPFQTLEAFEVAGSFAGNLYSLENGGFISTSGGTVDMWHQDTSQSDWQKINLHQDRSSRWGQVTVDFLSGNRLVLDTGTFRGGELWVWRLDKKQPECAGNLIEGRNSHYKGRVQIGNRLAVIAGEKADKVDILHVKANCEHDASIPSPAMSHVLLEKLYCQYFSQRSYVAVEALIPILPENFEPLSVSEGSEIKGIYGTKESTHLLVWSWYPAPPDTGMTYTAESFQIWDLEQPQNPVALAEFRIPICSIFQILPLKNGWFAVVYPHGEMEVLGVGLKGQWRRFPSVHSKRAPGESPYWRVGDAVAEMTDGRLVLITLDGNLEIWQPTSTGLERQRRWKAGVFGNGGSVFVLPGGRIVSSSVDGWRWDTTIKVWDLGSSPGGECCIAELDGINGCIRSVLLLDDGQLVIAADKETKIWNLNATVTKPKQAS